MPQWKCYDTIMFNGLVESYMNRIINGHKNLKIFSFLSPQAVRGVEEDNSFAYN